MTFAIPAGSIIELLFSVESNLKSLAEEFNEESIIMPVGIFLVIDRKHGGDATASEIIQRFHLLDMESKNYIDFYYVGWKFKAAKKGLEFNLKLFEDCRDALKKMGVREFGGN